MDYSKCPSAENLKLSCYFLEYKRDYFYFGGTSVASLTLELAIEKLWASEVFNFFVGGSNSTNTLKFLNFNNDSKAFQ